MSTDKSSEDGSTVKSVRIAFRILEHLKETNGSGVTEVAQALNLAKSTAHRHLTTLESMGYLVKEGDRYDLGFQFLELGEYTKTRRRAFELAEKKTEELAEKTDERAQFLVEEHGQSVFVHRATGENAVMTDSGIGKRVPIHASAAGKAILAHLPEHRVSEIIQQHGLPELTEQTITDSDELREELAEIRSQNYSINNQENIDGLRAIGVPVIINDDYVIGALSVSGPTNRFTDKMMHEELPKLLLGAANELALNIEYA